MCICLVLYSFYVISINFIYYLKDFIFQKTTCRRGNKMKMKNITDFVFRRQIGSKDVQSYHKSVESLLEFKATTPHANEVSGKENKIMKQDHKTYKVNGNECNKIFE